MIFGGLWGEVAVAAWPLVRCQLGLHKWKVVRRHVPEGFTVYVFGLRGKCYWEYKGERCACCGKFVKERTPWWLWLARVVAWGGIPAMLVGICASSGIWWPLLLIAGMVVFVACLLVAILA